MLKDPEFVSRFGWARGIQRTAVSLFAVGFLIGTAALAGGAVSSAAGATSASVRPATTSGAPCTFSLGSQSSGGTTSSPAILTGVGNGNSISVNCTGLNPADEYGIFQASPLAVVTQPFSLSVLGSEADIITGLNTLATATGGTYTSSLTVGTSAGGGFSAGGTIGSTQFVPDPNATCPPTQAEINAGLGTCVVAVVDISATTAPGAVASQADYAGESLLDFAGQASPQSPPTVSFNPPVAAAGHNATVSDAGSSTNWWAGGWWAGGYPNGQLNAAPYSIPASNVLLNGSPASGASVQVNPAVYCFYGGSSDTSCNAGTADTPGAGVLFPSLLNGTVPIPPGYSPATATVTVYEPNVWGSVFPGNNTNSAFPANDLTASGTIGITKVGYWEVASDGGVFSFGTANYLGSMGGKPLAKPVVGLAATPDGGGYWEVASDGGIFAFGDAQYYGSMGGKPLAAPIVGIASTHDGGGYWEVAADGGIFPFGDAQYLGSMGGRTLNAPVVGIAATPDGGGYWEVASDGGVFAFGDAQYFGSMGAKPVDHPVVGIAATPDGGGYWTVGSDGGIFTFGTANYFGSMGGRHLVKPVVGVWGSSNGQGYLEPAADGGIFTFGNAPYLGSTGGLPLVAPVVGGSIVPVLPASSITLTKSTTSTGYGAAGQTIPYSYLVTNSGATTLTGVTVSDSLVPVSCPSTTLAKGASETCTATYTVTQADVDSGSVTNSATASANGPRGAVSSAPAVVTVEASGATSSLTIGKSTTSTGYDAAGQIIPYTYTVTNTGTTTLNSVAVTDTATNGDGDTEPVTTQCPGGTVAPGAFETCTANYAVSQDDVDSGFVTNTASASAVNSAGAAVCPPSANCPTASTTVNADDPPDASLSLVTSTTSTFTASGQVIDYSYLITNTGGSTLTSVSVSDSVPLNATNLVTTMTCPMNTLAPGAQETCTGSYTTDGTDVTNASVVDAAQATGFDLDFGDQFFSNTSGATVDYTGA
jgi:uncharacterized repeat protein (TIGR01451 family)